jgi:hypothetical protein
MKISCKYSSIVFLFLCCLPLWGCNNSTKVQDCQKYELAIAESAKINPRETTQATDKQSFVASLNAIADNQQRMGEITNAVKLQDIKLQEIQKQSFIASNELANDFRQQAASIAALPEEANIEQLRAAIKRNPQLQHNWVESNNRYLEYCFNQRQ